MKFNREIENLIASFRQLPEHDSEMIERHTKGLDSIVEVLLERHAIGRDTPEELILNNWAAIVGPTYAKRCAPERIGADGKLVIRVANPILRREMMFHEDRIMTALRSIEGCEHIKGVVLKAG